MSHQSKSSHTNFVVSPYLTAKDVDSAANFYQKAFLFNLSELKKGEDGSGIHGELNFQDQLIMIGKEGVYESPLQSPITSGIASPITLCVYCEDVDKFYKEALDHGAQSVSAPENMFWGYRMCRLQDLDNYTWCFMTPLRDV
ncbi:MAG: hypothetical protein BGO67_05010 [Alphaproteobacteria bacterium 41-28]|nr:MAG: hypothetical protein BGO67_05010 [Alphaproteobacteria bacterium 41-28]